MITIGLVNQIDVNDFILFDDSFYSGTRNKIEEALKKKFVKVAKSFRLCVSVTVVKILM